MKKILFTLLLVFGISGVTMAAPIAVQSYNTPNDVTVTNLENNQNIMVNAINSADGALLQAGTVATTALTNNANPEERWGRAFNDWVFTGLTTPTTSGTLTSTTIAGEAFIKDTSTNKQKFVEKGATANTYTATKWTYVDLNNNGTYTYVETGIDTAEPAVTANSIRLSRVSTNGTEVTNVRDDRVTSISLGNTEDQYRLGLYLTVATPASLTVSPGVVYHGTTRVSKDGDTVLDLGTAADWATGISGRATSTAGYVVVNSLGSIKLTTIAPTVQNTNLDTAGKKIYSSISSDLWRVISWFFMNATGSGEIDDWGYSDIADIDTVNSVTREFGSLATGATVLPRDNTIPQNDEGDEFFTVPFIPTDADNELEIRVTAYCGLSTAGYASIALFQDSTVDALMAGTVNENNGTIDIFPVTFTHKMTAGTTSVTTFKVRGGISTSGTFSLNGVNGVGVFAGVSGTSITVTEIE